MTDELEPPPDLRFDTDRYVWTDGDGEALTFDRVEALGLDGTLRLLG